MVDRSPRWPHMLVAALLVTTAVVGCSNPPGASTNPALPSVDTQPTSAVIGSASPYASEPPPFLEVGLGPRSWVTSVFSEDDQTHISITRDLATDTVLRFPVGELAVAVGGGLIVSLGWETPGTSETTLRVLDASTGVETSRALINGHTASVAIRPDDVLFSIQGGGRDGGIWSLPAGSSTPVPLIAPGELPAGSDVTIGGRYLVWTSPSGRTVAADLVRTLDQMSLDVFAGQEEPRRIDLPERANIIGLTDEVALVMNTDFLGAVSLADGSWLWRMEISAVWDYYLTPDGRSVVAALVPADVRPDAPLQLRLIDLASGDERIIKEWAGDEQFPRLWPELSNAEVAVVSDVGNLGGALLVGDWSATGTAIRISDGAAMGSVPVTLKPTLVP